MGLEEFKHYREEERYEVGLAAGRLSSLLASQAFLFTGWAIIHGPTGTGAPKLILIVLPCIALTICMTALLAIAAAVLVIHRWQRHGADLVSKNEAELKKFHLSRASIDGFHFFGVDLFSISVPILFCALWIVLLVHSCTVPAGIDTMEIPSPSASPANSVLLPSSAIDAPTDRSASSSRMRN